MRQHGAGAGRGGTGRTGRGARRGVGERSRVVSLKKIVTIAVVALLLFVLIRDPEQAAGAVQQVLLWLRQGAEAVLTFVRQLFG